RGKTFIMDEAAAWRAMGWYGGLAPHIAARDCGTKPTCITVLVCCPAQYRFCFRFSTGVSIMSTDSPSSRPLRLGILGCANIARQFARDVAPSAAVRITAVASRKAEVAAQCAAGAGIGRSLGSYEALLADGDIDAVYIPLPNSLHAAWAIRAAERGKHVLCEKPLALNRAEAQAMFDAAQRHGVMLLEAYPYQFQPQTAAMLALLRDGAIGSVR